MANDTFSNCAYGRTYIYNEVKNKQFYDSQVHLTHTAHFINGKKFNELMKVDCCGDSIVYSWEQTLAVSEYYYFQDCEIGNTEYITNFSYNESRDTLKASVIAFYKEPTIYLQLTCTSSRESSFECVLMMNDHSILNRFALEGCEIELTDLQEGKYDSRIARLQSRQ